MDISYGRGHLYSVKQELLAPISSSTLLLLAPDFMGHHT